MKPEHRLGGWVHDIHIEEQLGYKSMEYVVLVEACQSEISVWWTGGSTSFIVIKKCLIPLRRILEVMEDIEENGLEGRPFILIDLTSILGFAEDPYCAMDDL